MSFPSDFFEDEYSARDSDEENLIVDLVIPEKEAKHVTIQREEKKQMQPQQTGFHPRNPVIYPKLKFEMPKLDEEGEEMKPWKKIPSTRDTYFNYGFTEEVWEAYKFKQLELRKLFGPKRKVITRDQTKKKETKH